MANLFRKQDMGGSSFLPEDYVASKAENRSIVICVTFFAVVLAGVIVAGMWNNRRWDDVRQQKEAINAKYELEAERIGQLNELRRQERLLADKARITNTLAQKVTASLILAELHQRLPEKVVFTQIDFESKRVKAAAPAIKPQGVRSVGTKNTKDAPPPEEEEPTIEAPKFETALTVIGLARDNGEIADYLTSLQDSPLLLKVELQYITESIVSDVEYRKFEITAVLNQQADVSDIDGAETVESEHAASEGEGDLPEGEGTPFRATHVSEDE
ncbi:MAG: PilN domain-containing protein [Phycisphaerales bacterium]|nr:PilN domain-containing protein [Phycisphaerales bacterium]